MPANTSLQPATPTCRVIVADDDTGFREGFVASLTSLGAVEVAGLAATGSDAVIEAWQRRPDIVLLDVTLPGMSAAETTRHIGRAAPDAAVCLLVTSESEAGISEALDAGARECLLKSAAPEEIAIMLRRLRRPRPTRGRADA